MTVTARDPAYGHGYKAPATRAAGTQSQSVGGEIISARHARRARRPAAQVMVPACSELGSGHRPHAVTVPSLVTVAGDRVKARVSESLAP